MKLHWLLPAVKGIPVLMYHRVWPMLQDGLTVTPEQLKQQWDYLKQEGYTAISLNDFVQIAKGKRAQNGKNVLLTFDDGYQNNFTYAYPLLKQMGWKATFFIIGDSIAGSGEEAAPMNKRLSAKELHQLDKNIVQLAMHGYHHENFKDISPDEIKLAIEKSRNAFSEYDISFFPAIAYPYGSRPGNKKTFDELKQWMLQHGVEAGFRIGNQVCKIPAQDIYEIKRIDIRGTDSLEDFKIKLCKGKLKPF